MTEEQIYLAAAQYMESASNQFKDRRQLLQFVCAVASISLSAMEAIGGEEQLKQFVADATGPNRMRTDVVMGRLQ